jgi:dipeptidyl aminopeptidase/acylaminoacyl peptidase
MKRAIVVALLAGIFAWAQDKPFDVQALMRVQRITDPQLSPDGLTVAFVVQKVDIASNTKPTQILSVPLAGGTPRLLAEQGTLNERPRWSPDSKQIAFVSNRSGSSQIWIMDSDGSGARQVTDLSTEASGVLFSPDGKRLVFASEVYPECLDEACNKKRLDAETASKVKARVYMSLLLRHWNQWQGQRRKHLFVIGTDGKGLKDLTPGSSEVPPFSLGGPDDYAISPDGLELCYVMASDPEPAVSTNLDLYVVPMAGGNPAKITSNLGADSSPQYSPSGKHLAYRSQLRAGYETDRWRLVVLDRSTGIGRLLTENLDRAVSSFTWGPDSARLFFTAEDRGRQTIQVITVTGGAAQVIASGASTLDDVQLTGDGRTMIYTEQSASRPVEIFRVSSAGGSPAPLTHLNDELLAVFRLTPAEEFWTEGADQAPVHGFMVRPPDFQPDKKYPVLFLIHGGPQGAWGQSWTYRWNAQVFAAAGYLVVMPNIRGSSGYGQKFMDDVNGDWGGRAYADFMAAADAAVKLPYADPDRTAAAGASYGGYMINWVLGHTARFKALVSHAGVFDLRSEFGETDELWFPLWEFRGTPWDDPDMYSRWSPSYFVREFKTPTLITHGELDYRVPVGQALQLFTALQLRNTPSKLMIFPDEGHWISKPQNSVLWYGTVIEWLDSYVKR